MENTTPYTLRDGLSYCLVAGHPVFLDSRNDRYFRLSSAMERAFVRCLEHSESPHPDLNKLLERNIIVPAENDQGMSPVSVDTCSCSALEQEPTEQRTSAVVLLEVMTTVCFTSLQMKAHKLRTILEQLMDYRRRRTSASSLSTPKTLKCLVQASTQFRRVRPYVPIEMCCLLDSLAMVKFLARRRLHCSIVFGVACDPFSAHCWVQSGEMVLNDTVGNISAFTPIRTV